MGKERQGRGTWKNPEFLNKFSGLPVICSGRSITCNFIYEKLENNGASSVFSIGIGTGMMYELFKNRINREQLILQGIDILPSMIKEAKTKLGGNVLLSSRDAREPFNIADETIDIVEAGLVLHHILKSEELIDIFRRIKKVLKPSGQFILFDIDVSVGEYIEKKLKKLELDFGLADIDYEKGEFVFKEQKIKILDPQNPEEKKLIANLDQITCIPLLKEMRTHKPEIKDIIEDNVQKARQGTEWHRSIKSWLKLIELGFGSDCLVNIIKSKEIKKQFPQVLDNPFIIVVTNK